MQNKRVICHIVLLYVCAKGIDFAPVSTILLLELGTFLTV
jgi:hypothetical protein